MKLAITYLLLFTYSTIMLRPILPYASDIIAHIFWYEDHIAGTHSHNGKFHVHKEVMEAAKSSSPEENSTILKKVNTATDHIVIVGLDITPQENFRKIYFARLTSYPIHAYLKVDFPPPKV